MKYIDADKLKSEIQSLIDLGYDKLQGNLYHVISLIDSLQQEQLEIDWDAFRREAAKDVFCEIISTTNGASPRDITMAIEIADELIKQLREKK